MEPKKSVPPTLKRKRPSPTAAEVPDIFACILKDTTSEHKTHLFDLNCKLCRGQRPGVEGEEPKNKKTRASESPQRSFTEVSPPLPLMEPPPPTATESELQRMLDELNKQIEVTERQIKVKEAGLRYLKKDSIASQAAPVPSPSPKKTVPTSVLNKPSSSAEPRIRSTASRTTVSQAPAEKTVRFLAKQKTLWKGFLNMSTVAKCITKGYLVSGSAENLEMALPHKIQIGGRIPPQTVWDYVEKLKNSQKKELCVIRFQPESEEEEGAHDSLFSYFSNRGRYGVVTNCSQLVKDFYLVPLGAKEPLPRALRHLNGPGLDPNHPKLLLGLVVVQRKKTPKRLVHAVKEQRDKVIAPQPISGSNSNKPTASQGKKALKFILDSCFTRRPSVVTT